jgi:hypothetical protein
MSNAGQKQSFPELENESSMMATLHQVPSLSGISWPE